MKFLVVISNSLGLSKALHLDEKLIINFNEVGVLPFAEKMHLIFKRGLHRNCVGNSVYIL